MALQLCHPYVWEDPRFIFKSFANDGNCMSELVNRVVLLYSVFILLGVLLGSATNISGLPLIFGIIASLFLIPTFMKMSKYQKFEEAFEDDEKEDEKEPFMNLKGADSELEKITSVTSNARNPFQNVMVDDYKYAPTRAAAPDITSPEAKMGLDAMFRTQWYSDPTDVYGKTQSQRMFLTQPISTVPNDQKSYQEWLYKIPGKTCKEGNYNACRGGTAGAIIPWLDGV